MVGALLEARAAHTSRTAYNHLLALAATRGIAKTRVLDVIDMVGLQDVASKRADGFSLGMGQRLGTASALLADPETLVLDEPVKRPGPGGHRLDSGPAQEPGRRRASVTGHQALEVTGLTAAQIGDRARNLGISLHGLARNCHRGLITSSDVRPDWQCRQPTRGAVTDEDLRAAVRDAG